MIVQEHEYLDFSHVPQSKGISPRTLAIVVAGVIGIFIVGFLTVIMASFGHRWPAEKTLREPLGSMPAISTTK